MRELLLTIHSPIGVLSLNNQSINHQSINK